MYLDTLLPLYLAGMATLLWDVIFEPLMVHLLNSLKKVSTIVKVFSMLEVVWYRLNLRCTKNGVVAKYCG